MSFQLMAWAAKQRTGSTTRKAVLMALANAANHHTGRCDPSIEVICQEVEAGPTAVKNALAALAQDGFVERERRRREDGSLGTYRYTFPHLETRDGQPQPADDPGSPEITTDARRLAEPRTDLQELNQETNMNVPASVARQPVTISEARQSADILAYWNEATGQTLRAATWHAKIIARLREHPELSVGNHRKIIAATLAGPKWWDGEATPSIVYGNDAQFERCIATARAAQASPAESAFDIAARAIEEERRRAS